MNDETLFARQMTAALVDAVADEFEGDVDDMAQAMAELTAAFNAGTAISQAQIMARRSVVERTPAR